MQEIKQLVRDCLAGTIDRDEQVVKATDRRGKAITCRVTCMPLQSGAGDRRDGVILLMEEILDEPSG